MSRPTRLKKKPSEFHQLYNEEWEKLGIFQGWLSSVKSSKYKAFCKYCKKEFRAHRTDLRTHALSRKHQKSADAYYDNGEYLIGTGLTLKHNVSPKKTAEGIKRDSDSQNLQITTGSTGSESGKDVELKEQWEQLDDDYHNDPDEFEDSLHRNLKKEPHLCSTSGHMANMVYPLVESCEVAVVDTTGVATRENDANIISTQVQDMVKGLPVDRLVVYLFIFKGDQWVKLGKGTTEKDGSCSKFISVQECEDIIVPGHYKLRFETKMHFTLNLEESLFPFIEVPFDVGDLTEEHKINLLISPHGYMVFRGS